MSEEPHPDWCVPQMCSARGSTGAHRSRPVFVDRQLSLMANLVAVAAAPAVVLVEIRCAQLVLPPRAAYGLGRLLVSLGRAAEGT
ncbi:MAG: hypothetical protein AUI14_17540 [Actinobacteria bacterium 13_2_20CM_2_71_6]|nr:MAG: hypothetical protein AUI14_17540 [Actinobacteria bacterium 13_2_20CM_2_71_6]